MSRTFCILTAAEKYEGQNELLDVIKIESVRNVRPAES